MRKSRMRRVLAISPRKRTQSGLSVTQVAGRRALTSFATCPDNTWEPRQTGINPAAPRIGWRLRFGRSDGLALGAHLAGEREPELSAGLEIRANLGGVERGVAGGGVPAHTAAYHTLVLGVKLPPIDAAGFLQGRMAVDENEVD